MSFYLINFLLLFIFFNFYFILLIPNILRIINFYVLSILLLITLLLNLFYNKSIYWYQYIITYYKQLYLNIDYTWGLDFLSLNLILLCVFLLWACHLNGWNVKYKSIYYFYILNSALWILINVFTSLDLFNFFIFFELIIVPMFLLIGIWGSRNRKITASYQLFIYTLIGSIFVFVCLFDILLSKGNLSFDYFLNGNFLDSRKFIIWFLLFIGFSIKVPIVPLHLWLPEAHVEAPTPGSVILAGILLKLGTYAIFRLLLAPFWIMCYDLIFLILIISLFSLTHSSIVALNQIDIKKIIAYSSVAHMSYSLLGLFSHNLLGIAGGYIMIFSHAITSSALFLGIGVLYDRYKTRLIFYYGGLASLMPFFALFYFIFILSNFGFPGTINFVGEFLLTYGILNNSFILTFFTTFSLVLCLMYSLFLYNKLFFSFLKNTIIRFYTDINRLEFCFLFIFLILVIVGGLYPLFFFDNFFILRFNVIWYSV